MSDGTTLNPGVGGDKVATDDLGATGKVQWVKLMDGTDGGTDTIPGTATSGLRVDPASVAIADGGALPAKGVQVGGTDGTVFQVMSTDNAGRVNTNINGTVAVSGPLTDTQLRATPVPVSGTVTTGGLTDTQLRATAVPVSGTVSITSNSAVNVAQVAGTAADVNSGVKSAGTQRVVLATDQPQLTNALKVDGSAVTQPVSASALPLPSGASTAAKQPALGTAGTASADVLSVQGVASMTPLLVNGSGVTQPVSGTVTATGPLTDTQLRATPVPVSGSFSASPASSVVSTVNSTTSVLAGAAVFTGTSEEVKDYAVIILSVIASHASATDGLSVQQSSDGSNWDIVDTYTIPAASGKTFTFQPAARYFRVVYTNGATLQTSFRLQTVFHYSNTKVSSQRPADGYTNETDLEQVQSFGMLYNGTTWDRFRGDTTNGLDVDVTRMSALVTGSAVIGSLVANQSVNQAQVAGTTLAVNAGTNSAGVQRVTLATDQTTLTNTIGNVGLVPVTTGGNSVFHLVSAATTNATSVKASAGQLYGYYIYNSNAAARKVAFHNTAGTPTAGASVLFSLVIPPASAANVPDLAVAFSTGIGISTTTGLTDADATAVAASDLIINLFYK